MLSASGRSTDEDCLPNSTAAKDVSPGGESQHASTGRRIKVAVIGTGLAGLTAAYLLSRQNEKLSSGTSFEVHVFEKASEFGMDAESRSVKLPDGKEVRVDVPMRSFQGCYYRNMISLYRHLRVRLRCVDFTYSFSHTEKIVPPSEKPKMETYFLYNGQNGKRGLGMPSQHLWGAYDGRSNAKIGEYLRTLLSFAVETIMIFVWYIRLIVICSPLCRHFYPGTGSDETFGSWVTRTTPRSYLARKLGLDTSWNHFSEDIVLSLFSAMCTSRKADLWEHPVKEILDYTWYTLFESHFVIADGVQDVVRRLSLHIDSNHVHLASPITRISPSVTSSSEVVVECPQGRYDGFSHVIFATQAGQAIPILQSYLGELQETSVQGSAIKDLVKSLTDFECRENLVVNHVDDRLLPADSRDRRDLNLLRVNSTHQPPEKTAASPLSLKLHPSFTMATHTIYGSGSRTGNGGDSYPLYQTTNPIVEPRADSIVSVSRMNRPIVTVKSNAVLQALSTDSSEPYGLIDILRGRRRRKTLGQLQGAGRSTGDRRWNKTVPGIWICGSYAYEGIPLLEGCVASARMVINQGVMPSEDLKPWDLLAPYDGTVASEHYLDNDPSD